MPSFLSHLASQPLPPREGSAFVFDLPERGLTVRARMPSAGSIFFTEVGGVLAVRAAREEEGVPDLAETQRATYSAILCATVDGVGPIGGALSPCSIVPNFSDATPASAIESVEATGDAPALWVWQVFDGASARAAGERIHAHAGEGRIIPPFVSRAEPSPASPASDAPSASTH